MSDSSKPREWIFKNNFTDLTTDNNGFILKPGEQIHMIEKSALDEVKRKSDKMVDALKKIHNLGNTRSGKSGESRIAYEALKDYRGIADTTEGGES